MRRHLEPDTLFRCTTCIKNFGSSRALDEHYRQSPHHPNCPVDSCARGFRNKWACNEHVKLTHPTTDCPCGDNYFTEERGTHYLTSPNHVACTPCNLGFFDAKALLEHEGLKHSNSHCTRCSRQFKDEHELNEHYLVSLAHPKCEMCRLGFIDSDTFRQHIAEKHSAPSTSQDPDLAQKSNAGRSVDNDWRSSTKPRSQTLLDIDSPRVRSLWPATPSTEHSSQTIWESSQVRSPVSGVSSRGKVQISDVTDTEEEEEEDSILSMVEGLVDGPDVEEPHPSNKNLAVTLYRSPITFTGPTKPLSLSLNLDTNFRSTSSCTRFDPLGPLTPSTTSPDTTSPTGLAALPTVSPLASTPSDITMINGSSTTIVSSPERMRPGEAWGVESTGGDEQARPSVTPFAPSRRDSASSVETRVEDDEDSGALTTFRVNQHWKLYNEAVASATHTRNQLLAIVICVFTSDFTYCHLPGLVLNHLLDGGHAVDGGGAPAAPATAFGTAGHSPQFSGHELPRLLPTMRERPLRGLHGDFLRSHLLLWLRF
ncbi:hypothetical protein AAF712_012501 [Marasmius tenuissimus]|uniref:C2H2-type domain-containing protein n=1 Tax=Marasmius tenuissimus TaxID=585030 RepID=A0ABR2ZIC3_9AGAR